MTVDGSAGVAVRGAALDVGLVVSETHVRLSGAGVEVSAPHGGVRPGLSNALHVAALPQAANKHQPAQTPP